MGIDDVIVLLDERIETLTKRMESDVDNRPSHAAAINALYDFKQMISPEINR
ncbi:hypothetical protein VCRA2116O29_40005 [Vibrio crassostreae]|uniref:hypothetical protein n=1 Tax=Vibrio TaxID=662 RepID=UPI000A89F556|nr:MULTISPECIES: hypothetical protein [Vibrio]CAK2499356.1 hypothetical protein VCRA2116O29_40005 [Vibrio crassostreae]